ncbi:peptidyl-tRNA hydrolase ICT1, mitochondrial isoform X1 [Cricetulus griseus]|uniref:peptidyl-tRNA hydrolase ICT1, mitochondrial isoform X1 n=1 Tax=Cricetulus griseus TaxID=10029 RepID=UPI000454AE6B|nr:peptidyl-tRNA hydrolase ICT1, mitochondrial isoform X1 [Cricetulus griseus]
MTSHPLLTSSGQPQYSSHLQPPECPVRVPVSIPVFHQGLGSLAEWFLARAGGRCLPLNLCQMSAGSLPPPHLGGQTAQNAGGTQDRAGTSLLPPPARCARRALHRQADGTGFQSIYSLDKLYPESKGVDTAWKVPEDAKQASSDIPLDRLSISYCRSSGPGGQNVNKVSSKAEVRFHLASADWIAEPVRQKIALKHKNKINKAGELILTSESSRYQFRNLAECLQKIRDMIAEASQVPKEPTKEDAQLQRLRIENMNRERLRQKRINSSIKTSRRVTMD